MTIIKLKLGLKRMKKITFYIAFFVLFVTHASAQTTYSFSGLSWGDPMPVVDRKLKAAGFSGCAMHEKLFCKAATTCRCQIQGPAVREGWVELTNDKLERVFVVVHNSSEAEDLLTKKYGRPNFEPNITALGKYGLDSDRDKVWKATTGDTLELQPAFRHLTYRSGNINRAAGSRDRANKSVF